MSEVVAGKRCSKCGESKPLSEFYPKNDRQGRLRYRYAQCRNCHYLLTQSWRHRHPEHSRRYAVDHKTARSLGLTVVQLRELIPQLGDRCEACGVVGRRGRHAKDLAIDHDHRTGEVRGLLCNKCNHALGNAGDDPELLRRLATYLENPPARKRFARNAA